MSIFTFQNQSRGNRYQVMKYSITFMYFTGKTVNVDIIGLYRSIDNTRDAELLSDLTRMISKQNICIIIGDFNLRYTSDNHHMLIHYLKSQRFSQVVNHPTHNRGGILDHMYIFKPDDLKDIIINWELYGASYTDHLGLLITINKGREGFRKMESSLTDEIIGTLADTTNNQRTNTNKIAAKKGSNARKKCAAKAQTSNADNIPKEKQDLITAGKVSSYSIHPMNLTKGTHIKVHIQPNYSYVCHLKNDYDKEEDCVSVMAYRSTGENTN